MKLEAKQRLLLTALNFKKLPFEGSPPEDFQEKFLKKFKGTPDAESKLWIYRRALRSYMDEPQYKEWLKVLDKVQKEL